MDSKIDAALWSDLGHGLANLNFLILREIVATQLECLERPLPGKNDEEEVKAGFPTSKPLAITKEI